MSENPQFYLIVLCLTHDEEQKGLRHPFTGFFVKLKRQYRDKIDALGKEVFSKRDYVVPCQREYNQRMYPLLGIFSEEEYEQKKNNPVYRNWKTFTPE